MGRGETLRRALAKLVLIVPGKQAKTACGNLQLCVGFEAGIDGATHAMGKRRVERVRARRVKEEEEESSAAEEEEGGEVLAGLGNLNIETAVTEEVAAKGLEAALETQEMVVEGDGGSEGEEGGAGTQRALEALEFPTQDAEPIVTTLVDACNGFNELSRLAMLWTVRHHWPA